MNNYIEALTTPQIINNEHKEVLKGDQNVTNEKKPNKYPWLRFIGVIIFGLINAIIIIPSLYLIIGVFFLREDSITLFLGPVNILGVALPIFFVIFSIIEILLSSFLVSKWFIRGKEITHSEKIITHIIILITFIILLFGSQIISQKISQFNDTKQNPIQVGTKLIDFSSKVVINNRDSTKMNLKIRDNKVIWSEHTKMFPWYNENVWEIFLFEIDQNKNQGAITQLSNFEKANDKAPDSGAESIFLDNEPYWIQDKSLYVYNYINKKPEFITNNVGDIYGKYKNSLLIRKADENGNKNLFFLDLTTKELKEFPFNAYYSDDTFSILNMNGSNFCYSVGSESYSPGTYTVGRYNVENGTDISFKVVRPLEKNFYPQITDCQSDYVVFYQDVLGEDSKFYLSYKVYDFNKNKYIFEKKLTNDKFQTMFANAKILNNKLYYTDTKAEDWDDNYKLMSEDLTTKEESVVIPQVSIWDMNKEYIVYGLKTPISEGYTRELYLQKID